MRLLAGHRHTVSLTSHITETPFHAHARHGDTVEELMLNVTAASKAKGLVERHRVQGGIESESRQAGGAGRFTSRFRQAATETLTPMVGQDVDRAPGSPSQRRVARSRRDRLCSPR